MIIIKIIILYFIQIIHTDDFPSTGIRLVHHVFLNQPSLTHRMTCAMLNLTQHVLFSKIMNTRQVTRAY